MFSVYCSRSNKGIELALLIPLPSAFLNGRSGFVIRTNIYFLLLAMILWFALIRFLLVKEVAIERDHAMSMDR